MGIIMKEYLEMEHIMKKSLKRLLPILLCLLVVCSIIWYLFVYDRSFTQDILIRGGRYFEEKGNHSMATWFYNQAYHQSGNNDDVIIELAQRFIAAGNYTKAEVTLSTAIEEGGSAPLYIALCKTYVEQDKLLDAANMLSSITDPTIKAQVEALRPAAPTPSADPGFYSKYLQIHIDDGNAGTLYVTTDGTFPSTKDNLYTDDITLINGENIIRAITVGENGLVSEPAYFVYTVGSVIEEVTLSDPALDAAVRAALEIDADTQLYSNDLWKITLLSVPQSMTDMSDLSKMPYLEMLVIEDNTPTNLQVISSLTSLKALVISSCTLSSSDLTAIGKLSNLEALVLSDCGLSNIEALSALSALTTLDLSRNAIRDVTPLSFMSNLTVLDLSDNALTNLSALSALSQLQQLSVSNNALTSLTPLSTCNSLSVLDASGNQLTSFPTFLDTTVLTSLNLANNDLTQVSAISGYSNLTELNISNNQLTSISELSQLDNLELLDFSRNQVTTLPSFNASSALTSITGSHNNITSISPLSGHKNLNYIVLEYNNISTINALSKCSKLIQVDVFGNPVKNVTTLTKLGIIVNYDPT